MKIRTIKGELMNGMNAVSYAVGKNAEMSALRNVRLVATGKDLVLTATNLDITVDARVKCDVIEEGSALLDADAFLRFVKMLPEGCVDVDTDATAHITGGEVKYNMAIPELEFPVLPPTGEGGSTMFLPSITLAAMLRLVGWSMSTDRTRSVLCGVNLSLADGKVTVVATNGKSLGMIEHETGCDGAFSVTVPAAAVGSLCRLLKDADGDVTVWTDGKRISFACSGWEMTVKVSDDVYPLWRRVVPTSFKSAATVDRELFLLNLQRAAAVNYYDGRGVKVTFGDNSVAIEAKVALANTKVGMDAKYDGEKISVWFDPQLLRCALEAVEDNEATFEIGERPVDPVVIRTTIPWIGVVMPLREG